MSPGDIKMSPSGFGVRQLPCTKDFYWNHNYINCHYCSQVAIVYTCKYKPLGRWNSNGDEIAYYLDWEVLVDCMVIDQAMYTGRNNCFRWFSFCPVHKFDMISYIYHVLLNGLTETKELCYCLKLNVPF